MKRRDRRGFHPDANETEKALRSSVVVANPIPGSPAPPPPAQESCEQPMIMYLFHTAYINTIIISN